MDLVTELHVAQAADFSLQQGLLTNDALLIVLMQDRGLSHLMPPSNGDTSAR
jgi:predicted nucleic acid-binding protein